MKASKYLVLISNGKYHRGSLVDKAEKQYRPANIHSPIHPAPNSSQKFTVNFLVDYEIKEIVLKFPHSGNFYRNCLSAQSLVPLLNSNS